MREVGCGKGEKWEVWGEGEVGGVRRVGVWEGKMIWERKMRKVGGTSNDIFCSQLFVSSHLMIYD